MKQYHFYITEDKYLYKGFFPLKELMNEWKRPWKLILFLMGMSWLIYGALFWEYSDWDIGVSLIMGILTYLFSSWSLSLIIKVYKKDTRYSFLYIIAAILTYWFCVDGSYYLWHTYAHNRMFRYENFIASSYLYFLASTVWLYKGTMKEFKNDIIKINS